MERGARGELNDRGWEQECRQDLVNSRVTQYPIRVGPGKREGILTRKRPGRKL